MIRKKKKSYYYAPIPTNRSDPDAHKLSPSRLWDFSQQASVFISHVHYVARSAEVIKLKGRQRWYHAMGSTW